MSWALILFGYVRCINLPTWIMAMISAIIRPSWKKWERWRILTACSRKSIKEACGLSLIWLLIIQVTSTHGLWNRALLKTAQNAIGMYGGTSKPIGSVFSEARRGHSIQKRINTICTSSLKTKWIDRKSVA